MADIDTINALLTLAELKEYLSSDSEDEFIDDTSNDNQLKRIINSASLYANNYTSVDLLSREQTEYRNGDGSQTIFLNNFPVSQSADFSLWLDSDRAFDTDTLIDADYISIDYDTGHVYLTDDVFPDGVRTVKITYTAGYTSENIPADLQHAMFLICEKFWKLQKDKLSTITSTSIGGNTISFKEKDMPESALEILDRYSRV